MLFRSQYNKSQGVISINPGSKGASIRSFALLDKNKIVFAADSGYQDGNWHPYKLAKGVPSDGTSSPFVRIRILSSTMNASLVDIKAMKDNQSTRKTVLDSTVNLEANASGNGTIAVLLYDASGSTIKYYRNVGSASSNKLALNLSGIPVGKYKVAIINEEVDPSSNRPLSSSAISNFLDLEIVNKHEIQYTKTPGSGASAGVDYEYSKNVNAGNTIGKITLNPTGVTPITYEIVSDGDNTYQNFEIDGLDGNNASSNTSLNVKIKSSAPDLDNGGLKVGTYKFCITSTDDNGYPDTQINGKTKVCTSFNVNKTKLTIEFNDKHDTKKTIPQAATPWNETATGKPTYGTKITYTKVGGDIGLIDLDENTGKVTYKGNGVFGKVKIRATIDDDPSTGNDNYDSAYTEKEIIMTGSKTCPRTSPANRS